MNIQSKHNAYFSFYWNTNDAEQQDVYAQTDALIDAAIKGGMKKEDAVKAAEQIFSAGWSSGTHDEAYNSNQ